MDRMPVFDAVRTMLGRGFTRDEIASLDHALDLSIRATPASPCPPRCPPRYSPGEAGKALIRKWEGCARRRNDGQFEAYPDPGSSDGHPWTIGWGSTGSGIGPGTVWSQERCDARLNSDITAYADQVARAIGDASTTQNQFDALLSFHYNTGQITTATLTKLHRLGRHAEAQAEFGKWVHNGGRVLKGLVRRRAEEAALYALPDQ